MKYHINLLKNQPVSLKQITDEIIKISKKSNRFYNKKINQPFKLIKTLKPVQFKVLIAR